MCMETESYLHETSAITHFQPEACRVMPNGDPEGRILLSYPYTNNGFFFLLTIVFIYLSIYLSYPHNHGRFLYNKPACRTLKRIGQCADPEGGDKITKLPSQHSMLEHHQHAFR